MEFLEIWDKFKEYKAFDGIKSPNEMQQAAVPAVLSGRDVIIQSPTGTGKTLAYLLPIFTQINWDIKGVQGIVIAPTYELASQIAQVAKGLTNRPDDVALLIGQAAKKRQEAAIKAKPRVIVGSLGRVVEFIMDKKLSVHHVRTIVFDEADRMFTPQNADNIEYLTTATLKSRQIVLASATVQKKTQDAAQSILNNPEFIAAGDKIPTNITHHYIVCDIRKKTEVLRNLLNTQKIEKALVFVNMPYAIEKTTDRLNHHKLPARALQATTDKNERKASIDALRNGKIKALVSTDAGSRGLDIPELRAVINLDIPSRDKDYLHRAGRTGRAGRMGTCISVVTEGELLALQKMAKKLKIEITPL